ncbi:S-formylglutathione hydrolase [Psychrobium sp. 1_MG-2023]|uniref:S-formylglutathione hydrolase n=1 Tax=Psychrobium sp. 1_MG-2023 TaxID=3062624 RepID=UPI000C32E7C6|nr:S-formylglutathione hydrolase [Psychrobium sp. 1_MG-2023]MDP2560348.1 S-formylglutathione hydrolase [Psychrobium sp. 1_MG-2023]PKF55457.1 S-formylglutathione hydrolase [Alteromonadales bacterium alter-6D02]
MSNITLLSSQKLFNGTHNQYQHQSETTNCPMTFSVYLPPEANNENKVPALYFLSGLTCTDENFSVKAGAQQYAAKHGIALIMPDTSPRGEGVPDDLEDDYAFGQGAGFYVNATQKPWNKHFKMYDYVVAELPKLIESELPVSEVKSIFGHSMGGHGALVIALRNAKNYRSVSAFSPITNPIETPWGQKALYNYLGDHLPQWLQYDACHLVAQGNNQLPMLIDQGLDDQFLEEELLLDNFISATDDAGYEVTINQHEGYNHSYFFITTFIESHLDFHAKYLLAE